MGAHLSRIALPAGLGHGLQNPSCFSPSPPRHVQPITVSRIARAGLAQACPHTIHALVHHGVPWNQLKKIQQWPKCCLVCCYLLFVVSSLSFSLSLFLYEVATRIIWWVRFRLLNSNNKRMTYKEYYKSLALTPHYPSTPPLPDYWLLYIHILFVDLMLYW